MDDFKIWFSDLTPEAQERLMAWEEIAGPEEMNWDKNPIAYIEW